MSQKPPFEAEKPSADIEIIPPDAGSRSSSRVFLWTGSQDVKVIRLGPFGSLLMALAFAIVMALGFIFLTGVFLFLVPVVAVLGTIFYLTGAGGNPFRRLR